MIRDEPIMEPILGARIPLLGEWRCTIPGRETDQPAKEDASLRRGTYVRTHSAEHAATLFVEHEGLRKYEQIDVQRWSDILGTPTSPAERLQVIGIRAGARLP